MSTDNDLFTYTADDYTVELHLGDNIMFNKFYTDPKNREKIHNKHEGSAVSAFRQHLIEELPLSMALEDQELDLGPCLHKHDKEGLEK